MIRRDKTIEKHLAKNPDPRLKFKIRAHDMDEQANLNKMNREDETTLNVPQLKLPRN
jgi:hypothetical protein